MGLDRAEVEKIAHLARLALRTQDIPSYVDTLSNILELVDRMNAVETSQVPPMAHPLNVPQRLRADAVTEPDQRERLQAGAPQVERGLYLVPKVIE